MSKPKEAEEVEIPDDQIKELLTDSELRMIHQRLRIIQLIQSGLSIRSVAKKVGVGTDTVMRMTKKLKNSDVLKRAYPKKKNILPQSKWVFGQITSEEED